MSVIEGKIKSTIFYNEANSYLVALFRVSKVDENDEALKEYLKKTITITGNFFGLKVEVPIRLDGGFVFHEKFGRQFKVNSYEIIAPEDNADILDFLSSSFVKGCGKKTAEKIVEVYGKEALNIMGYNFGIPRLPLVELSQKNKEKLLNTMEIFSKIC